MYEGLDVILRETHGDVTVVKFAKPRITEEVLAKQAGIELKRIAQRIGGKIVMDLSNVLFISSVGLSELITFNRDVRAYGGHVKVCGISPLLRQVFVTCGLNSVLDICATRKEALDSFHTGSRMLVESVAQ